MHDELPPIRQVPFPRAFHCGNAESGCTSDQACTCACEDAVSPRDGLPTCCPRRREAMAWFEALPPEERNAHGLHGCTGPFPGVGFGIASLGGGAGGGLTNRNPFGPNAVLVDPSPPPTRSPSTP